MVLFTKKWTKNTLGVYNQNTMLPILFSIGSLDVRANTTFFILGCVVALWVAWQEVIRQTTANHWIYNPKGIIKFFVLFLPFAYLVGMLNSWFFHFNFFFIDPTWQEFIFSGWISYGGIIGALLFGLIYPKKVETHGVGTLDIVALILPLFEAIYRIGCLLNGCCYGKETSGFGGLYLPNSRGLWTMRYPTQILYIALGFGLFALLWLTRNKKGYEGEIALRYLILYGLGRFLIDGLRANLFDLGVINLHQSVDLALMAFGLMLWCVIWVKRKRVKNIS